LAGRFTYLVDLLVVVVNFSLRTFVAVARGIGAE